MKSLGNLSSTRFPVVIMVKENDLPIFFSIVGNRKKIKTYKAVSDENDGFYVERCKPLEKTF